jgi:hypothetical protein
VTRVRALLACAAAALPACTVYEGPGDDPGRPAAPDGGVGPDARLVPDAETGPPHYEFAFLSGPAQSVYLGGLDGRAALIAGPEDHVTYLEAAPTGAHLAFGGFDAGARLRVVRLADGAIDTIGAVVLAGRPSWSPDGSQLVFVGQASTFTEPVVLRASLDSDVVEVIGPVDVYRQGCTAPTWSPDGREVAYAYRGELRVRTMATGATRTLVSRDVVCEPAWSPDGRAIAFSHGAEGVARIALVGSRGGPVRDLVALRAGPIGALPRWSPEGRTLAFLDADPAIGTFGLRLVGADGGAAVTLIDAAGMEPARWSADGRSILFTRYAFGSTIARWDVAAATATTIIGTPDRPSAARDPVWLPVPVPVAQ